MTTILKVDRELAHISSKLPFGAINPTNIISEEKKVLKDQEYNPEFHYKPLTSNLIKLRNDLRKIKIPRTNIGKILHEKRIELLKDVFMLKSLGTKEFTKHSLAHYGRPSKELLNKAKRFLLLKPEKNNELVLGKISIVKKFLYSLMKHNSNCEIVERDMAATAAVNSHKKKLYLNPNRAFTESDLQRLTVHEVGTHIKRGENARKQKLNLFLIGFPGYLATEEGLAMYNEEKAGLLTNNLLRNYAARVVGVDLALKNSFNIVYNSLREFLPDEDALKISIRVKRGLKNTSKPGGFTKDFVYLQGWYDVRRFVAKGGNVKDLYMGKIGVRHVPILKDIRRELGE